MIQTEREYLRAMRNMVKRIQNGEQINVISGSIEDLEILADCIRSGYINGSIEDGKHSVRTMDGKIHPTVFNNHIPLKGIAFLHPRPDWKFLIPTIISLIALVGSFLS